MALFPRVLPWVLGLASLAAAQVPVILTTPEQVYREFRADGGAASAKYRGKTVQVTGRAYTIERSSFPGASGLHFQAQPPYPEVSVQCYFKDADLGTLNSLKPGQAVTVVGRDTEQISAYAIRLHQCRVLSQGAASPVASSKPTMPADPPLGAYAVYQQAGAAGFAYQYSLKLVTPTRYQVNAQSGAYTYDTRTKALSFTSGPLKGFGGLYYTSGRNANGPTIAVNVRGAVTNLNGAANGAYQFAFHQP